jgi:pSer/pThr/pTyr-binding forkhead associated (FHA) protein
MNHRKVTVGRSKDNDVVLSHSSVSRHHLEFFFDGEGNVFLTDLNSLNGTFVNGQRINGSAQLSAFDVVNAGSSEALPWRNYATIDSVSNKSSEAVEGRDYEIIQPSNPKNSNRSTLKTVAITLASLFFLLGIVYFFNEYTSDNEKPVAVDPEKPNETGTQPDKKKDGKITYDFSCLEDKDDGGTTKVITVISEMEDEISNSSGPEVTLEEEENVGDELLIQCRNEYEFITKGSKINNLRKILYLLVAHITKPKGFHYQIHLIKSDELNAFTAGAEIFVTTKMYEFCKSNDELACVIGHEINHNELGHIKQHIQKQKLLGQEGAELASMMTIPFNQKKETHCDFTGIDLAIAAGYNGCVNIGLWKRMKKESNEGDFDTMENLFRSHPYSEKRAVCSKRHIKNNYGYDCEGN